MRLAIVIVSLLLISSLSFAQDFRSLAQLSLPFVIFMMIVLLSLLYMASQMFQLPQLTSWVKTEIRELVVAAILFVIVFAIFNGGANTLSQLLTGDANYYARAHTHIAQMKMISLAAYDDLIRLFHAVGMRAGFSASIGIPLYFSALNSSGAPYSGYSTFFVLLSQAANGLSNLVFIYTAMEVLLDFFVALGNLGLIYLAFAFRFIPFTRQLGSTLVALVLGASVIYPFSLVFVSQMHSLIDVSDTISGRQFVRPQVNPVAFIGDANTEGLEFTIPLGSNAICKEWPIRALTGLFGEWSLILPICIPISIATFGVGWAPCTYLISSVIYPILVTVTAVLWSISIGSALLGSSVVGPLFDVLNPFFLDINNLAVIGYVDVILSLIITYITTKSISTALGGEYMIPGVQRLVG